MIKFRRVYEDDFEELHRLSQLVLLINLPRDKYELQKQISLSVKAFDDDEIEKSEGYYMFVAEDSETGRIIGTSMAHGKHGTEESPHNYFQIEREERYSETQKIGMVHTTLHLVSDTNGPSEIGGLVLDPEYRGSKHKYGKSLSYTRFAFIALNRDRFEKELLAELLPPFDEDGNSPLWEAIGRKFTGLNYFEADLLSRKNKEFILNLFPKERVYATLLPADARESIGAVGDETKPVERMLIQAGFKYAEHIDPFDGGPHFQVPTKDLIPLKKSFTASIKFGSPKKKEDYLMVINQKNFEAIKVRGEKKGKKMTIEEVDLNLNLDKNYFFLPL